jgi:hypothetical protein
MGYKSSSRLSSKNIHALILIFSAVVHLVTIVKEYAWADDWAFIVGYRTNSPEAKIEHFSGLRPILQVIMDQSFGRISQYENLIFLRLISLIGLLILIYRLMKLLREIGYSEFTVCSFGILINFLPTFWIYTNWASVFSYTWACLFSLLSFNVFIRSKLLGLGLIISCFLIYQPAAVFSTFVAFAYLVKNGRLDDRNRLYLKFLVAGSFIGFLIGRLTGSIVGLPLKARTEIVDSPLELVEKIIWILTRPVLLSIRPFIIESRGILAAIFTVLGLFLTVVSLWQVSRRTGFSALNFSLTLISVYAVGLLPLLVIAENQIEFRTLPATSCFGLLFVVIGTNFFFDKFLKVRGAVSLISFMVLFALLNYSQGKINYIFIDSFRQNYNFIKSSYSELNSSNQIVVLIDSVPWSQSNSIGALSVKSDFQMPWVPIGAISQILGITENQVVVQVIDDDEVVSSANTIDLRKLREQLTNGK